MKKLLLLIISFFIVQTAQSAICTQNFTTSGSDSGPTVLTINSSDINCNSGNTINSLTLVNGAGSLTSFFCNSWFDFTLVVDGGAPIVGCAAELNNVDITGFTTLTITSADTDNYTDNVSITIDVEVDFQTSCTPVAGSATIGTCTPGAGIMIDVDVTDLGDGVVNIANDAGVASTNGISSLGVTSVGPFPFSSTVIITIENPLDPLCNIILPSITLASACPPSNDECSAAIALTLNADETCTSTTSGTIAGATASNENTTACFGTENDDVWYSFVATSTLHEIEILNISGGTTDLYHSLWTGTCGALVSQGLCSDPNTSSAVGLTVGDTYYLRINSWTSAPGQTSSFDVCIKTPPPPPSPPANDDCSGAIQLTVNADLNCTSTSAGTIESATASPEDATACSGTENDDVWYSFVATSTIHDIEILNITGGTSDLYHSLWEGSCGSLTHQGLCSDPNTSTASDLTIGSTYYLRVYSWTSTAGQTSSFDVCIKTPPPPPPAPANDDADAPVMLTVDALSCTSGGITSTTISATDSGVDHSCANYQGGDVWFSAVVPNSGTITIETSNVSGSFSDAGMSAYSDSQGLNEIDCDDDGNEGAFPNSAHSKIEIDDISLAGTTIYIAVWEYGNDSQGDFNICAWDPTPPPANDDCTDPTDILDNGTTGSAALTGQSLVGASPSGLGPDACDSDNTATPADVWFRITTGDAGTLIVNVIPGANSDVVMSLYNSCGDPVSNAEGCGDLNGDGGTESINVIAALQDQKETSTTRADEFFLRVYEKNPTGETFTVETQGSALPIELSSFDARAEKRGNRVIWSTLSEINSDYVEVQSSPNGSTKWETVGRVEMQGESYEKMDYEFFDENPHSITYYRLHSIDKDERSEMSHIINVSRNDQLSKMTLSPNPTDSRISLQTVSDTPMSGSILVYDMTGVLVYNENINLKDGLNTVSINLENLSAGVYLFSLKTENGVQIEKIVKQ